MSNSIHVRTNKDELEAKKAAEAKTAEEEAQQRRHNKKSNVASVRVDEHPSFDTNLACFMGSTTEVRDLISSYFREVFNDYVGCIIGWNSTTNQYKGALPSATRYMPPNALFVDLYFKYNNKGVHDGWNALSILNGTSQDNDDYSAKHERAMAYMNLMQTATTSRAYQLTDEAKDILSTFAFEGNVNWNDHLTESLVATSMATKEELYGIVSGLSFNKIISEIYGVKTDGEWYQYKSEFLQPIRGNTVDFILSISRLEMAMVRKLEALTGARTSNGSIIDLH